MQGVEFDPVDTLTAAQRIDALAERLERALVENRPALAPAAAGADEVSVRASATVTEVSGRFDAAAKDGILELRKLAANLRNQTQQLGKMEDQNATVLGGTP